MEGHFYRLKRGIAFLLFCFVIQASQAQCILMANATPGLSLTYQSTNLANCSGVAYNPNLDLYYAVRAGNPGFPLETWDQYGTQLYSTSAGFDYRGMWWNQNTNQMEANGYSNYGVWAANLNGSGYALNTGTNIFSSSVQPNSQSCGDYDPVLNYIIYYYNSRIYQYSRATGTMVTNFAITGLPVATSSLNWTTVMYTGCPNQEYAVLDVPNKRLYLINKSTGAYSGMSQLPASAVTTNGFRTSWANNLLWLFDLSTRTWYSYNIFQTVLDASQLTLEVEAEAEGVNLSWEVNQESEGQFILQRSLDGLEFEDFSEMSLGQGLDFQFMDADAPNEGRVWYRVALRGLNGEFSHSNIAGLSMDSYDREWLRVYPNPADLSASIDLSQATGQTGQLQVIDLQGKVVKELPVPAGQLNFQLPCSDLASGVYHLHLRDENRSGTAKMMVQH